MDEIFSDWVSEAYQCLWAGKQAATAELHGFTVLTCFPADRSTVTVRDEYPQIWNHITAALEGGRAGGLVVTGHPGVGKTYFLKYALAMALKAKIPVAYCEEPGFYYFCDARGCRRYPTAPIQWHKMETGKLFLALVDSNSSLAQPPLIFFHEYQRCYTIQTTSPDPARYYPWAEEARALFWIMPPWTEAEVLKLQQFYQQQGPQNWSDGDAFYSPVEIFNALGPSAQKCFAANNHKTPQGLEEDFLSYLDPNAFLDHVDAIATTVPSSTSPPDPDFHRILSVSKRHGATNPMHAPKFHHYIPTLFLCKIVSEGFRRRTAAEQVALIAQFAGLEVPHAMSFIYKPTILHFLGSSQTSITCHLADCSTFSLGPGLVLVGDQVDTDASIVLCDNRIYILRKGFPWIDAFIISEDQTRVTILQMTVAFRREVVSSAVTALIQLVKQSMPGVPSTVTKWSFIFVSPGASGEKMARKLQEVKLRGHQPTVFAGWLEIGALLSYPEEVLDALKREDAEDLKEVLHDNV
ncbi:hypothetical protein LXA43DRAFT_433083 [Ganoderma leucocontextum]|nr:hypothetical protein LXA43DRAFT_433083 [Ganoderma leucocontextum]